MAEGLDTRDYDALQSAEAHDVDMDKEISQQDLEAKAALEGSKIEEVKNNLNVIKGKLEASLKKVNATLAKAKKLGEVGETMIKDLNEFRTKAEKYVKNIDELLPGPTQGPKQIEVRNRSNPELRVKTGTQNAEVGVKINKDEQKVFAGGNIAAYKDIGKAGKISYTFGGEANFGRRGEVDQHLSIKTALGAKLTTKLAKDLTIDVGVGANLTTNEAIGLIEEVGNEKFTEDAYRIAGDINVALKAKDRSVLARYGINVAGTGNDATVTHTGSVGLRYAKGDYAITGGGNIVVGEKPEDTKVNLNLGGQMKTKNGYRLGAQLQFDPIQQEVRPKFTLNKTF